MQYIELEGMEFYSFHGYYEVEKKVGTRFLVDLQIQIDNNTAGQTDNLKDALNYQKAYNLVKEEMEQPSNLLEHVATRILERLHDSFPEIIKSSIRISKMNPPMGGKIDRVSYRLIKEYPLCETT